MPFKSKEKKKKYNKEWRLKNRDRVLKYHKDYRLRIKKKVLSHYCEGGLRCECCGEKTLEFLCLDHIDGGGTIHRKKIGRSSTYFWIIRNEYPKGFRVLCHNCNQAIGSYGKCPHKNL